MMLTITWIEAILFIIFTCLYKYFNSSTSFLPISSWRTLCLGGILYALTGMSVIISGLPERTPSYLQGILLTIRIPFTVLVRFLWLHKDYFCPKMTYTREENTRLIPKSVGVQPGIRKYLIHWYEHILLWAICGLYIASSMGMVIFFPMYITDSNMAGGSAFSMMLTITWTEAILFIIFTCLYKYFNSSTSFLPISPWWTLCLGGTLYVVTGTISIISGLPERTPPYLQAILLTIRIPFTVLVRFLWLHKGYYSLKMEYTSRQGRRIKSETVGLWSKSRKYLSDRFGQSVMWAICGLYIASNMSMVICLPIFITDSNVAGGSTFSMFLLTTWTEAILFIIFTCLYKYFNSSTSFLPISPWWIGCLGGILYALTGFGIILSGSPERTPSYLQGILVTMKIPFTVIVRFLWLHKGLSYKKVGCILILFIGIFITLEPVIWPLPGAEQDEQDEVKSIDNFPGSRVVWPLLFSLAYLPFATIMVLCERELKKENAQPLNFILWTQIFQAIVALPFFWVDLVPYVGTASSFGELTSNVERQVICHFSSDASCHGLALKAWVYILSYFICNLFAFLLIQRAEGAVFTIIVQAVVTPLATIFWTLFSFDKKADRLNWTPEFTITTGFTLLGLAIIVPCVVVYNILSRQEAREDTTEAANVPLTK